MTSSLENTSFGRHISKKYAKTEGLDFSKILMKKDHLDARTGDETCVSLKPTDFFKILRLLGEKNDDDIESACYSLITCLLENDDDELDPAFVTLLNNQQSYNITFPEDGESYNTLGSALTKNEIAISSVSMNEIAKFLGKKDAIGISDFISIAILMFSPEELENRKNFLQRLTLKAKILEYGKPKHEKKEFNGIGEFDTNDDPKPIRGIQQKISHFDTLFKNVDAFLQNEEQTPFAAHRYHKDNLPYRSNRVFPSALMNRIKMNSRDKISSPKNSILSISRMVSRMREKNVRKPYVKPQDYYMIRDITGENHLISEKDVNRLEKAKLDNKLSKNNTLSLLDKNRNMFKINEQNLDVLLNNKEHNHYVQLKDINGKKVIVNKAKLDTEVNKSDTEENNPNNPNNNNDQYNLLDYENNKVIVNYVKPPETFVDPSTGFTRDVHTGDYLDPITYEILDIDPNTNLPIMTEKKEEDEKEEEEEEEIEDEKEEIDVNNFDFEENNDKEEEVGMFKIKKVKKKSTAKLDTNLNGEDKKIGDKDDKKEDKKKEDKKEDKKDEEDKKEGENNEKPKWVYKPKFRPKKDTFYIRLARVEIQQESDSEEF